MRMELVVLPDTIRGIYSDKASGRRDFMPRRLRMLAPDAARRFLEANGRSGGALIVSDMYRSPGASLQAVRERRGALPPGRSMHNYGLAVDLDVDETMQNMSLRRKVDLDKFMLAHDFVCCRLDHKLAFESWHYSFVPGFRWVSPQAGHFSTDEADAHLRSLYGNEWKKLRFDLTVEQQALARVHLYHGQIDGILGTQTRHARDAFNRAWEVHPSDYDRVLALVSAELAITEVS